MLERKNHFHSLIALIGGESDQSNENKSITEANMPPMPLHNYEGMNLAILDDERDCLFIDFPPVITTITLLSTQNFIFILFLAV